MTDQRGQLELNELDYRGRELNELAAEFAKIAAKKARNYGADKRLAGQLKTLTDIQAVVSRLACDIVNTLRREHDKSGKH